MFGPWTLNRQSIPSADLEADSDAVSKRNPLIVDRLYGSGPAGDEAPGRSITARTACLRTSAVKGLRRKSEAPAA